MELGEVVLELDDFKVRRMNLSAETLQEFWEHARQYPVIFGKEVLDNPSEFISLFIHNNNGTLEANGLFFVVNDFLGIFYLTDIIPGEDALAHYTFFDRRHHNREELVRKMLEYVFKRYDFQRLSVQIPNYATPQARHFIQDCGFSYEGKRRKAAFYKNNWFDINLYGILKSEVLNG